MKKLILSFAMFAFLHTPAFAGRPAAKSTAELNAESVARTSAPTDGQAGLPPAMDVEKEDASDAPHLTVNPMAISEYRIIPGDVLQINVWKEDGLDQEILVLPDGTITFRLAGTFSVRDMTPEAVQATIKDRLKQYIPDATVTVSVKAALGHTVSVIGQVTKPGEFIMGHGLTVMQALSQAGGLTPYADEGDVLVLRRNNEGVETSIAVPYDDISRGRHLDQDIVLEPGDVVVVPTTSLF